MCDEDDEDCQPNIVSRIVCWIINWRRKPEPKLPWEQVVNNSIPEYLDDQRLNTERNQKLVKLLKNKGRL